MRLTISAPKYSPDSAVQSDSLGGGMWGKIWSLTSQKCKIRLVLIQHQGSCQMSVQGFSAERLMDAHRLSIAQAVRIRLPLLFRSCRLTQSDTASP